MESRDFGKVSELLERAQKYSTPVGKVWLSVLFVFRIFVLVTATKEVWSDEQSNFLCDTRQPGCQQVCYDKTFPISHVRFWVMQIIFVSSPTLIYLWYVIHPKHINEKKKNINEEKKSTNSDDDMLELEGMVLKMYISNIVFKILLEVAFLMAHYYLYGFGLNSKYDCDRWPCLTMVYCYVSRPTEKTVFIIFMLIVALVSVVLNVVELFYLLYEKLKKSFSGVSEKYTDDQPTGSSQKSYL